MGILGLVGTQVDVLFGDPRVSVYVRLTGAYRSLSRPSSVPKPRYPPSGGGVLGSNRGQVQIAHSWESLVRSWRI